MKDHKRSLIDLLFYLVDDNDRCVRFVFVILALALATGLGLRVWL